MSTNTRWLALILVGACGTAASAQAPPMAGMPYYPQYPYGPPMPPQQAPRYPMQQQLPQYPMPGGYAPRAYYPQPQPRVMYVSATPDDWTGAVTSALSSSQPAPVGPPQNVGKVATINSTAPAATSTASAEARTEAKTQTQLASLRKDIEWEVVASNGCGKDVPCKVAQPPQTQHRHHHDADVNDCTNWLPKGHCTLQFIGGAYADLTPAKYSWGQGAIRIGHICAGGDFWSHYPGAIEFLAEANVGANYLSDFGNHFYGGGLIVRYNFVNPGSRLVPYAQLGVGAQFNDASRDNAVQAFLGSPVELTAQAQVGFRLFLCKSLTLDFEGGVQRFGNINMSSRDDGITALGGGIGLTYFLPHHAH